MTVWYELPPGPERRQAMLEHPMRPNISPEDYTEDEWAALEAKAAPARRAAEEMIERRR